MNYQVKMRQTIDNCLLGEAFWTSSVVQTLQPPSKLARTWAMPRRLAAANPITNASWLGSLHSNIHSFKCFSCSNHQIQHLVFKFESYVCVCSQKESMRIFFFWITCLILSCFCFDAKNPSYNIQSHYQETSKYPKKFSHRFLKKRRRRWRKF